MDKPKASKSPKKVEVSAPARNSSDQVARGSSESKDSEATDPELQKCYVCSLAILQTNRG